MYRKLILGLASMIVIPITVGMAVIVNSLQTFIEIPLWLSSLVGTLTLAGGAFAWEIKHEENERRATYMREWGARSHLKKCDYCNDHRYHERKPFKPNVPRRMP